MTFWTTLRFTHKTPGNYGIISTVRKKVIRQANLSYSIQEQLELCSLSSRFQSDFRAPTPSYIWHMLVSRNVFVARRRPVLFPDIQPFSDKGTRQLDPLVLCKSNSYSNLFLIPNYCVSIRNKSQIYKVTTYRLTDTESSYWLEFDILAKLGFLSLYCAKIKLAWKIWKVSAWGVHTSTTNQDKIITWKWFAFGWIPGD